MEICRSKYLNLDCAQFDLDNLSYRAWQHFCATFDTTKDEENYVTKIVMYMDGKVVKTRELLHLILHNNGHFIQHLHK